MHINSLLSRKWIRVLTLIFGSGFLLFSLFFFLVYFGGFGKLPSQKELLNIKQSLATQILDRNGEVIGKYFIFDRRAITFEEIPPHLIDALIATEDVRFYRHDGLDKTSLLRVFFKTLLLQDDSAGGGSTLTQQLAKNLFGRTKGGKLGLVASKFKEFILAQRIESVYDKNEILTLYLNTVPFPDNTYGIESASQKFFDKSTKDLTLNESAILVGTLKANHSLNPRLFPERAKKRRDVVIDQMLRYDLLTASDTVDIQRDTILLKYQRFDDYGLAPYFRELLRKDLKTILADLKKPDGTPYDFYQDGLSVQTTIDKTMQEYAEAGMREHMAELQALYEKSYGNHAPWKNKKMLGGEAQKLPQYKQWQKDGLSAAQIADSLNVKKLRRGFHWNTKEKPVPTSLLDSISQNLALLNCGFMAMDPHTGDVLAYIGGIDYEYFKYDHVSQAKRMVGSTFKPFVYTTALEQGMEPCTYYTAEEETYLVNGKEWTPSNADGEGDQYTSYSLKGALSNSVNTVAVKVMLDVGIGKVISQAKRMGIETKLPFVPSLALGTAEIRIRDLAKAYTPFVNNGHLTNPSFILKITDRQGSVIFERLPATPQNKAKKVISDSTRQMIVEMLRGTVNEGTATRLRYKYKLSNDIAGKTGTTQDNKDGWFVGLTPNLISVTWVGNDDYRIGFSSTNIGQGANSALPIFAKFYQKLSADTTYAKMTAARFERPSERVRLAMDCEPTVRDSTSLNYFFGRIFGSDDDRPKATILIDSEGKRIIPEETYERDNDSTEGEDKEEKKGFFSFLKRNRDKDTNDDQ